ncbi:MAG: NFACT family protein [Anaerolineae bacterium]|nr:NFACT family protein [Anaerolineae bacterium]
MTFDTFSTAAMASELRQTILGGRVQRVTQINSLTYGLEIYVHPVRHYLILSAEPQAPRLFLSSQKVRRGTGHETPLMLVLRKYMHGARLAAVDQPAYERLLYLSLVSPVGSTILAVELMGTRSNLILLDLDQTILGVARLTKNVETLNVRTSNAVPPRTLLPGQLYEPPPPQLKLVPTDLTEFALRQELAEASPQLSLARLLTETVTGVSPLLAREIVYRATGSIETQVGGLSLLTPLLTAFHGLFDHLAQEQWQPTLALDEEDRPLAFAPYPLQHLPRTQPYETLSAAVEIYFMEAASGYAAAKAPLFQAITDARQKLARRRERLAEDAAAQADPNALKEKGEAILTYAYQIKPGQKELVVPFGERQLKVALDPALSASENAQEYFSRYRKALRAGGEIPAQLEKITLEENYLEQLEQDLLMAENRPEIDAVAEELAAAGFRPMSRREKQQKKNATRYLRLTAPDGATVWVGKNALQNAHLTFNRAAADDLWLHARNVPGAHVVIPTAQGLPSEADVFWAAAVAAYYSRARNDTSAEVDVTLKKYVRAIKGAAPGLVTYRNESTLRVAPEAPEVE